MKQSQPISIKAPPHVDFCFGYPGVSSTRPRLVGTVEIRSNGLDPIPVSRVSISLIQNEKILAPSKSGGPLAITSTKYTYQRVIGSELILFRAPDGSLYERVSSLDLPFVIEIPSMEELPAASLLMPGGVCETKYCLIATLHQGQSIFARASAPVKIERFDNLSTWDVFQVPRLTEVIGSDRIAQMNVILPVTCFGPFDPVVILVNILPNPNRSGKAGKVRVNRIQVTIEEILSLKPPPTNEIITKQKRILRSELDCSRLKLDRSGISREIRTKLPCKSIEGFRAGIIDSSSIACPLPMGFTTNSTLYSIEYRLTIRAGLSGAKDIVSVQPIHVCYWGSERCAQIMTTIEKVAATINRRESYPRNPYRTNYGENQILME